MTIKATSLLAQVAEAEIVYFEEKGAVTFRPGAITDDMFERVQAAAEDEDENVLNKMLAEICVSWDVVDGEGKPIPFMVKQKDAYAMGATLVDDAGKAIPFEKLSAEQQGKTVVNPALGSLPIPFKSAVLEQVIEAARGNSKASSAPSRVGSRRRGR